MLTSPGDVALGHCLSCFPRHQAPICREVFPGYLPVDAAASFAGCRA